MYNEERKNAFLDFDTQAQRAQNAAAIKWCESAEEIFEKDVSEFNSAEFDILLNHDKSIRYPVVLRYRNLIKNYVKWCIDNKLCENVELWDYLENTLPELNNIKNYTVGSPEEAMEFIERLTPTFNSCSWSDCRIRIMLIAAYIGVSTENLLNAKRDDIDFSGKIWYNDGTALPIWDIFIPSLKKFLDCREFITIYSDDRVELLDMDRYDSLVIPERVTKSGNVLTNKPASFATILISLRKRYFDTYLEDFPFSVKDMFLSGRFYRSYKGLEDIPPTMIKEYRQWQKEFH